MVSVDDGLVSEVVRYIEIEIYLSRISLAKTDIESKITRQVQAGKLHEHELSSK